MFAPADTTAFDAHFAVVAAVVMPVLNPLAEFAEFLNDEGVSRLEVLCVVDQHEDGVTRAIVEPAPVSADRV